MSIESGNYRITNVRFANLAFLADGDQSTPITADNNGGRDGEVWILSKQGNGKYNITNKAYQNAAWSSRPTAGQDVLVKSSGIQWDILETNNKAEYTINPYNDTDLYWSFPDNQIGSPVTLVKAATTDKKVHWKFEKA
ncbi:unnamed protein product [Rhizoctonia solani]|nr:unnamed protein product [Rhizoctonia solani]